jgi:hypothetical protein
MVQIILKGIRERHPNTIEELMPKPRCGTNGHLKVAAKDRGADSAEPPTNEPADFELLTASLGVIFQERYGWTEEQIDNMTLPQVFLALEHAMEYDAPCKKSVWNL